MSRTIRRKQKWQEQYHIGSFESNYVPTAADLFSNTGETYQAWSARRLSISNEKHYQQRIARFHADTRVGRGTCPRWWRRMFGTKPMRCLERARIIRHLQRDDWDAHISESRVRNWAHYW